MIIRAKYLLPIAFAVASLFYVPTAMAEWTKQNSGTLAALRSVYFIDENKGWIVGSNGTFLVTDNGGKAWKRGRKFTDDNIRDVYFSDPTTGWLLCDRGPFRDTESSPSYLMRTIDGGSNWERNNFPESSDRLVRFFFTKDGYGFAVGEGGGIWQMLDDKKTWKRSELPSRFLIFAGTFIDDFNGVLVGSGGTVLFTFDRGVEWKNAIIPAGAKTRLHSVFFINQDTGWTAGVKGKIYVTSNGGKVWREQTSGINQDISDIFFVNLTNGFAVGDKGTIIETKSGGVTWTAVDTGFNSPLERVFFIGKKGFIVGFGGVILTNRVE